MREARTQGRSLLKTRSGLQPLDLGLRPSSSCWWAPSGPSASLNLSLPFPQLRLGAMRRLARRPAAQLIL